MEELAKRPGIVGYAVKDGDDLFGLAKRFGTTEESICEVNGIEKEKGLQPGERILIDVYKRQPFNPLFSMWEAKTGAAESMPKKTGFCPCTSATVRSISSSPFKTTANSGCKCSNI